MIVFLQNSYSAKYAGREFPRELWIRIMAQSQMRTPRFTRALIEGVTTFRSVFNASPICASHSGGLMPADPAHVGSIIIAEKPDIIVTLGASARRCVSLLWSGPLFALPHPAHFTSYLNLYEKANHCLKTQKVGRLQWSIPRKGQFIMESV